MHDGDSLVLKLVLSFKKYKQWITSVVAAGSSAFFGTDYLDVVYCCLHNIFVCNGILFKNDNLKLWYHSFIYVLFLNE